MATHRAPEEMVYEFTIAGGIGPAVTAALGPCLTAISEVQTVVGAKFSGGVDLADLVLWLEARGLAVASIAAR